MPRYYACDHCGRSGDVTLGVYYPGKDITREPVRLCQTFQGNIVTPNCYHLVVERGEQLGIRKVNAIMETDRQSPKSEGVTLRFAQGDSGGNVILTETERREANLEDGLTPYGEVVQGDHPLTGQRIPLDVDDVENPIHPAITEAEKGKGIIDPYGATQRPLIDPASTEGQELADAAAEEQARRITVPASSPRTNPAGQTVDFPRPPDREPISPDDTIRSGGAAPGPAVDTIGQATTIDPGGNIVFDQPTQAETTQTPAQVAAEAQRKVDEREARREPKMRPLQPGEPRSPGAVGTIAGTPDGPVDDEAARQAAEQEAVDKADDAAQSAQEASEAAQSAVDKAPAKKAPAKKAAKKAQAKATGQTSAKADSPLADVPDDQKPQAATEVAKEQESEAGA